MFDAKRKKEELPGWLIFYLRITFLKYSSHANLYFKLIILQLPKYLHIKYNSHWQENDEDDSEDDDQEENDAGSEDGNHSWKMHYGAVPCLFVWLSM